MDRNYTTIDSCEQTSFTLDCEGDMYNFTSKAGDITCNSGYRLVQTYFSGEDNPDYRKFFFVYMIWPYGDILNNPYLLFTLLFYVMIVSCDFQNLLSILTQFLQICNLEVVLFFNPFGVTWRKMWRSICL